MTDNTITLTESQVEELGRELDAIRARIVDDLGTEDREYIYKVIKAQRGLEVAGRAALFLSALPPFWLAGTAALSLSKILDNMEIGHNVMHGQYDWMREPGLNSKMFEWDNVCPSDQWRHSHNYMHHTFTNILGKDRDIGYGVLRMEDAQKWRPVLPRQPDLRVPADDGLRVGRHGARSRGREHHRRQAHLGADQAAAQGPGAQGRPAGAQGLRPVPAADRPAVPVHPVGERDREHRPQHLGVLDHLLRALPDRCRDVHRSRDRERDARSVVRAADARLGQHHRRQAVPHHVRQPVAPDRAPPVPGPAGAAVSRRSRPR